MEVLRQGGLWLRAQPDRPLIILVAHICVVLLYISGHAVSPIPFSDSHTGALVRSNVIPIVHGVAAALLLSAVMTRRWRGPAASVSLFVWGCTTVSLFLASHQRVPQLAYWSFLLSLVITLAAFLMLVRWGVDGDDRGGH